MRLQSDQRGFSLVELIITVGIVAIVAGLSINLISHIGAANSEKVVQAVDIAMSKVQVNAMKKAPSEKPYLYIYTVGDTYYYIVSTETSFNDETMGTNGVELGSGVKIYKSSMTAVNQVSSVNPIKISYMKDGSFIEDIPDCFYIKGKTTYKVKMNKNTGKHFVTTE